jgi:hypothetical protein
LRRAGLHREVPSARLHVWFWKVSLAGEGLRAVEGLSEAAAGEPQQGWDTTARSSRILSRREGADAAEIKG